MYVIYQNKYGKLLLNKILHDTVILHFYVTYYERVSEPANEHVISSSRGKSGYSRRHPADPARPLCRFAPLRRPGPCRAKPPSAPGAYAVPALPSGGRPAVVESSRRRGGQFGAGTRAYRTCGLPVACPALLGWPGLSVDQPGRDPLGCPTGRSRPRLFLSMPGPPFVSEM